MFQLIENLPAMGATLAELYRQKAKIGIALKVLKTSESNLKFSLIPPGGWVGKNADERKIAEESAYRACGDLSTIMQAIFDVEKQQDENAAEIEAAEAERRAGEHMIYALMAEALSGVRSRSSASAIGQTAVKDVAKAGLVAEVAEAMADPNPDNLTTEQIAELDAEIAQYESEERAKHAEQADPDFGSPEWFEAQPEIPF